MIIPYQQLSSDSLQGLIESFIHREGTDYGVEEFSLADKVSHVQRQLESGEVVIVFDEAMESVSILSKHDANDHLTQGASTEESYFQDSSAQDSYNQDSYNQDDSSDHD